jgi:hypothetical protein
MGIDSQVSCQYGDTSGFKYLVLEFLGMMWWLEPMMLTMIVALCIFSYDDNHLG